MHRRDRLTYDLGTERQRVSSGPSLPMIALLIVVIMIATLLVVSTLRSSGSQHDSDTRVPPDGVRSSSVESTSGASATSSAFPAPGGTDAEAIAAAPDGSVLAAEQFTLAWLEREPDARESTLKDIAAPGLVEQLMLTSSTNIPETSPAGDPVLSDASTYSVEFEQSLSNGTEIRIYLVSDPEARYGWLATSVEEA